MPEHHDRIAAALMDNKQLQGYFSKRPSASHEREVENVTRPLTCPRAVIFSESDMRYFHAAAGISFDAEMVELVRCQVDEALRTEFASGFSQMIRPLSYRERAHGEPFDAVTAAPNDALTIARYRVLGVLRSVHKLEDLPVRWHRNAERHQRAAALVLAVARSKHQKQVLGRIRPLLKTNSELLPAVAELSAPETQSYGY